jgi:hypothetical protein
LDTLRAVTYVEGMQRLVAWLEEEEKRYVKKAQLMISKGKISFDTLFYLFTQDNPFFAFVKNTLIVGAKVVSRRFAPESLPVTNY